MRTAVLTLLVGRDEQLALLLRRWEQAKDGEGQVVLLPRQARALLARGTHKVAEAVPVVAALLLA